MAYAADLYGYNKCWSRSRNGEPALPAVRPVLLRPSRLVVMAPALATPQPSPPDGSIGSDTSHAAIRWKTKARCLAADLLWYEHMVAEAMIEKAIREPQHMIERAEAALPQKMGFEVAQQLSALGLRRRQRRSCYHSYFNQMRDEQPGKIGNLDQALRCRW